MQTHIQKWENSLGVRIPVSLSSQLKLKAGSLVDIKIEDNHLVTFPQKYSLQDMLDHITEENIHTPVFMDTAMSVEE